MGTAALASLLVGSLALAAATLHLGRPIHAYRALKMWKRSWLSREVLLFALFSGVAALYAALLWFDLPGSAVAGLATVIFGIGGVIASAYIYRVPARPSWNTPFTLGQFLLTAGCLGPLFAAAVRVGDPRAMGLVSAAMATIGLTLLAGRFLALAASDRIELQGTARLLSTTLRSKLIARGVLLALGGVIVPLLAAGSGPPEGGHHVRTDVVFALALAAAIAGEILGRYLFFVSVVPTHMSSPYVPRGSEAA
jgi:DMSO reductase anchor subunit